MPDTMIQTEAAPALPASCGVMSGYRSANIGKLVAARAKASSKIKSIVKAKKAEIPSKTGGRGYQYAYADLADVLEAVEEAISEQGLAILQTTQDRGRDGTYLLTTLAHESDQWIASEIRLKSADAGPQVYGSEMSYLRRYAVLAALALAPEADDDGKAAQDRADQHARQRPAQRTEQPRRTDPTPQTAQATQHAPGESDDAPPHIYIEEGVSGLKIGAWVNSAKAALEGRPEAFRRAWLEAHLTEVDEVRRLRPDWADKLVAEAIAPDPVSEVAP